MVEQQRKNDISTDESLECEVCPRGGGEDQFGCESLEILFLAKSGVGLRTQDFRLRQSF
jgi:hypothetical protein